MSEPVTDVNDLINGADDEEVVETTGEDISRNDGEEPAAAAGEDGGGDVVPVDVVEDMSEIDMVALREHEEEMKRIAKEECVEVRFRHPKTFSPEEDMIIAMSLRTGVPLYAIMDKIHCSRPFLMKHIENTPDLLELLKERDYRRKDEIEEGLDDCVKARSEKVLMWMAEKLMPEKYGDQVDLNEEDDTRIVIGAIPEEEVQKAEALVKAAAEKPPEVGVAAIIGAAEEQGQKVGGGLGEQNPAPQVASPIPKVSAPHVASPHAAVPHARPGVNPKPMLDRPPVGKYIQPAQETDTKTIDEFGGGGQDNYNDMSNGLDDGFGGSDSWLS